MTTGAELTWWRLDSRLLVEVENLDTTTDPTKYRARAFALKNVLQETDDRIASWLQHASEATGELERDVGELGEAARCV